MALFIFTSENANNKKRANKINLNFEMLQNIDKLSSGDDAADIFLLNNNKNERSETRTHTLYTIFIDPLH